MRFVGMKEYKLKELFDLQMGKTPSRNNVDYWNDPVYKWISIGGLSKSGKYISETKEYLSEKAVVESGISIIPENTVIMSFKLSIGKTAITSEPMYSNEAIMSFRDKHITELMPDYIYYLLLSKDWEAGTNKAVMGKTLNKATLSEIVVGIHDIANQKIIVSTLDKLGTIIEERKKELQKLDDLIKARFVEMFGDCKYFELLGNAGIFISDGNYSSKYPTADEFKEEGIPFIRASNMVNNTIIDDDMYYISEEKHAELQKGHVKPYDVLIATRGAGIGKIAVVPKRHDDSNINAQIVLLRCNKAIYNPLYLSWYMKMQETQIKIQKLVSGSAQPQLPVKRLIQLEILKADINKQNEFADFVKQVDKSKVAAQKSLNITQLLFDSLMQKYFGG